MKWRKQKGFFDRREVRVRVRVRVRVKGSTYLLYHQRNNILICHIYMLHKVKQSRSSSEKNQRNIYKNSCSIHRFRFKFLQKLIELLV